MTDTDTATRPVFTTEAAKLLGVTPSGISRMVKRGALAPVQRAPGQRGAFLFDRSEIERLAAERGR